MGRKEEDKRLAEEIWRREGNRFSCLIGLDGFVDEVVHAVDQRTSADEYSRISTIREYGERILEGSGLSLNLEIVPIRRKIGGNGPIYADGLKRYGGDLTYIGCVGEEGLHPLFRELAKGSRVIGVADPGQTDAMEFLDGKIIRSKTESLNRLTWEKIIRKVPVHTLAQYFAAAYEPHLGADAGGGASADEERQGGENPVFRSCGSKKKKKRRHSRSAGADPAVSEQRLPDHAGAE